MSREHFYVQREPRAVWHVESDEDPEVMLCGETIEVDTPSARVQHRFGLKPCLWCQRALASLVSSSLPSTVLSLPSGSRTSPLDLPTALRDVTMRTGSTS